jgi:hypothetical protein
MKIHQNRPQLKIDAEFMDICRQIKAESKNLEEWNEIESDDMFQTESYCGGFDGVEQEFCFSYYDNDSKEWWFQISLNDVDRVISTQLLYVDLREAEY